jgi:sortase A
LSRVASLTARRAGRRRLRLLGWTLIGIGLVMILYWASGFLVAGWRQHEDQDAWRQLVTTASAAEGPTAALTRPAGGIDFRLRVPAAGYDAIVREGVGLDVLLRGPGHYPGSAWPGQPGVVGIAAHNVYWIRFDQLRPGDGVIVDTRYGTYRYRITRTMIIAADDTSVLQPAPGRQLALTTCWPLWAGEFATSRLAILAAVENRTSSL